MLEVTYPLERSYDAERAQMHADIGDMKDSR
jgi:hypothetical protein